MRDDTMIAFFEQWKEAFNEWPYAERIYPSEFLIGKSAWQSPNRGIELNVTDNARFHLFMTPYNITSENVRLMGLASGRSREVLNWRDERPKRFMTAYHEIFVSGDWRPVQRGQLERGPQMGVRLVPLPQFYGGPIQPEPKKNAQRSESSSGSGGLAMVGLALLALAIIYQ